MDAAAVLHDAMLVALKLCAPLLLAPLAAGFAIAVFQAITQISDTTLAFLPKLVATGLAAWLAGPFMAQTLTDSMQMAYRLIVQTGGDG